MAGSVNPAVQAQQEQESVLDKTRRTLREFATVKIKETSDAIRKRLEERDKTTSDAQAALEKENQPVEYSNPPGTESISDWDDPDPLEPDFSDISRSGGTRLNQNVGLGGIGLRLIPEQQAFTPGSKYLGNREISHAARTRLRYPNNEQSTPLRRGTRE